jgi:hypothetical protein
MHLILDNGKFKATMQPRVNSYQSRTFCCDAGHDQVEDAAKHGGDVEVADELAMWLGLPLANIVITDPQTGDPVDPHMPDPQIATTFDKRVIEDDSAEHVTQAADGTITACGHQYKPVAEDAQRVVGLLIESPAS